MHDDLFLQHVRDLSLEKGKAYLQAHLAELADHEAVGNRLAEEALRLRGANPFVSLTLAELLIFFGSIVHHPLLYAHGLKAKGDALEYIGHYEGALEAFDVAGQEFLRQGDEVNWAHTRIGWITACAWLGRTDEA